MCAKISKGKLSEFRRRMSVHNKRNRYLSTVDLHRMRNEQETGTDGVSIVVFNCSDLKKEMLSQLEKRGIRGRSRFSSSGITIRRGSVSARRQVARHGVRVQEKRITVPSYHKRKVPVILSPHQHSNGPKGPDGSTPPFIRKQDTED